MQICNPPIHLCVKISVVDPGCLSRIPDPDLYPSRIPDPRSKNSNKREGWKQIYCHTIFCSHKFHKIQDLFTPKIVNKLPKIWVRDPGSETGIQKNLFRIPDPGIKKAPDPGSRDQKGTGSRIRICNTGKNWLKIVKGCISLTKCFFLQVPVPACKWEIKAAPFLQSKVNHTNFLRCWRVLCELS